MSDLFSSLLQKHQNPLVPVIETIADAGAARSTDPSTSHAAAKSINASKLESLVLACLSNHGPMTAEQVALQVNRTLQTITPRFAPLCDKQMIEKVMTPDGYKKERSRVTGRLRLVYRFQPDKTLWRKRPKRRSIKQQHERIEHLEAALRKLRGSAREMANRTSYDHVQGLRWLADIIDQTLLENDDE